MILRLIFVPQKKLTMAHKEQQPTIKKMTTTKVVAIPTPLYTLTGEEIYYFTVCLNPNDYTDRFGREVTEWIWQVDETQPIFMECAFDYDAPNSNGQTVLAPMRIDETLKGRDYEDLIQYLNDELADDQCSEVDLMPGDAGFTPYYITNDAEMLVSVHDPALPGVVLVDAA